jgi:predicted negative regulator of RcsB-dependent stress response
MLENLSGSDLKDQFKNNKQLRIITIGVSAILVLVIGYFAYRQFLWSPANEKSKEAYYPGLNYAAMDSVDKAIDELTPVVKKYDGKSGGEIAQFVLARQFMAKGDFDKALKELQGVKVSDTYVSVYALGLQGDCYSEKGNYEKARDYYLKAAKKSENEKTSPDFLFKAGLVSEQLNDFTKANELYTEIKENFRSFSDQKAIDKYIARTNRTKK